MKKNSKIYVAGSRTPVGLAILNEFKDRNYGGIIPPGDDADSLLTDAQLVDKFFSEHKPEYVFLVGGRSAGISANQKYPADLMLNNLLIQSHVIHSAYQHGVKKLLYLASSCCYPRECPQPMKEEYLLTGPVEPTNAPYAIAKIAGIKLCQAYWKQYECNFIVGIPSNPFGPGDEFDPENSHVIEALISKMHQAKLDGAASVEIWGTGKPRRDFIFTAELASACIFVMENYDGANPINLGTNSDISIAELAEIVRVATGFDGELTFNHDKLDGMPRKCLDSTALHELGWRPKSDFRSAITATYDWFLKHWAPCGSKMGFSGATN